MECTIKITLIVSAVLGGLVLCLLMFRSWYKSRKAIQMPLVEKMAGPILNKKHEESQLPFPKDDKKSALLQPQKEEIEEILDDEEPIKHSKHPSISKDNPLSSTELKKIPVNNMNEFLGKLDNFSKAADQKNLDVDQLIQFLVINQGHVEMCLSQLAQKDLSVYDFKPDIAEKCHTLYLKASEVKKDETLEKLHQLAKVLQRPYFKL